MRHYRAHYRHWCRFITFWVLSGFSKCMSQPSTKSIYETASKLFLTLWHPGHRHHIDVIQFYEYISEMWQSRAHEEYQYINAYVNICGKIYNHSYSAKKVDDKTFRQFLFGPKYTTLMTRDHFYQHILTPISTWISKYNHLWYVGWNNLSIEIWGSTCYFTPTPYDRDVFTCPCWD